MTQDVSVVVITRNRRQRIAGCLSALLDLPERPEVVVVDNGSTDGTPELVAARFPGIRLIRVPVNHGATARNAGVRATRTPLVAFADDDSGWRPGALERAASLFREHPRLGLVAARVLVGADQRLDPLCAFMASAPLGVGAAGPHVLGFLAFATVVRREAFLATGGFDGSVFFLGEEARVAYDLAAAGWDLAYREDVVAVHRPHRPDQAGAATRRMLAARNDALTAWMRRPLPVALSASLDAVRVAAADRHGIPEVGRLLRRLPGALARRRAPHPAVERRLALLARREAAWAAAGRASEPVSSAAPPGARPSSR